jgi:hypothetical protein
MNFFLNFYFAVSFILYLLQLLLVSSVNTSLQLVCELPLVLGGGKCIETYTFAIGLPAEFDILFLATRVGILAWSSDVPVTGTMYGMTVQ